MLPYRDFEFAVCQTVHLVNRRPVAFKDGLRDGSLDVPDPICPENLIRGYDLLSINVIPELQNDPEPEWDPTIDIVSKVKNNYETLQNVCSKLIQLYNEEYLATLVKQAVNVNDRYKPVLHKGLKVGDIVLIKDPLTKPSNYPMVMVKNVVTNVNGEITGAIVKKGKTGELLKRHSSTLIPLLTVERCLL